jgi:hypothetical protein
MLARGICILFWTLSIPFNVVIIWLAYFAMKWIASLITASAIDQAAMAMLAIVFLLVWFFALGLDEYDRRRAAAAKRQEREE